MSNVYLKVPSIDELHYRQEWMNDSKTMSYNAGYDMQLKGYNRETGTITKTDEEMLIWYNNWINKEQINILLIFSIFFVFVVILF